MFNTQYIALEINVFNSIFGFNFLLKNIVNTAFIGLKCYEVDNYCHKTISYAKKH